MPENVGMADRMSETEEKAAFIRRVKLAREAKFEKQRPVYEFLGIAQDTYKQYEARTPLPHRYIPKFCMLTEVSIEWLLTGEGKGAPAAREYPPEQPKRSRRTIRSRAA